MIVFPPIETDLLRLVDRADQQADSNREKLDLSQRNLDIASNHQTLVQDPVENVDEPRCTVPFSQ